MNRIGRFCLIIIIATLQLQAAYVALFYPPTSVILRFAWEHDPEAYAARRFKLGSLGGCAALGAVGVGFILMQSIAARRSTRPSAPNRLIKLTLLGRSPHHQSKRRFFPPWTPGRT
jgi:hypothetical protein